MRKSIILGLLVALLLTLNPVLAQDGTEIDRDNASDLSIINTIESEYVEELALSSDGRLLAVAEGFPRVRIWDTTSGELQAEVELPEFGVQSVAFSPDGEVLAAGTSDGVVFFIDPAEGQILRSLQAHEPQRYITDMAWMPDGSGIFTTSDDFTIKLWDVNAQTGVDDPFRTYEGHDDWVQSVAVAPDGSTFVSASDDESVILWDVETGESLWRQFAHDDWVRDVAFAPNGELLASAGDDGNVIIYDVESGEVLSTLEGHEDWVRSVAFGPDSELIVSASQDESVRLWTLGENSSDVLLSREYALFFSVAFSADGTRLAVGATDGLVTIFGIE